MSKQQEVFEVIVDHLSRGPDVALAAVYGSFGTSYASDNSDVDVFFVVDDDSDPVSTLDVIVDDIGYDVWPLRWRRLERIAALDDVLIPLLIDSSVVVGSPSARSRFGALRAQCRAALEDVETREEAAQRLLNNAAANAWRAANSADDRIPTADAVSSILTALAFRHGTYLPRGPGPVLDGGAAWLSPRLHAHLRSALLAPDRAIRTAGLTAALFAADERSHDQSDTSMADRVAAADGFYEEMHSTLIKVPRAVASGKRLTAALAATAATKEIGSLLHLLETGTWTTDGDAAVHAYRKAGLADLLAGMDDSDQLADRVASLVHSLPLLLGELGVGIRRFATAEELSAALSRPDSVKEGLDAV